MDHLNRARQEQQLKQQQDQQQQQQQMMLKPQLKESPLPRSITSGGLHPDGAQRMSPSLAALVSATMRGAMSLPLNGGGAAGGGGGGGVGGVPGAGAMLNPPSSAGMAVPIRRRLSEKPNLPSANAGSAI